MIKKLIGILLIAASITTMSFSAEEDLRADESKIRLQYFQGALNGYQAEKERYLVEKIIPSLRADYKAGIRNHQQEDKQSKEALEAIYFEINEYRDQIISQFLQTEVRDESVSNHISSIIPNYIWIDNAIRSKDYVSLSPSANFPPSFKGTPPKPILENQDKNMRQNTLSHERLIELETCCDKLQLQIQRGYDHDGKLAQALLETEKLLETSQIELKENQKFLNKSIKK